MLKVYDNGSVYVGEMTSGKRMGKGTLYILDDFFAGYKVSGNWQNDKLHGWVEITTKTYNEKGIFNNGVKTGSFLRYYKDGRCSAVNYNDGVNISEETYSNGHKKPHNDFGCIKLSEDEYYVGDIWDGLPCGYGMIYNLDNKKKITGKMFCKIYGHSLVEWVELDKKVQENEDDLSI
ncbi:MAG: hypothetical protein E7376_04820 [Clostridiales bacterium]|nr:hypothetical protein [Clostridiales bacterium]